MPTAGHQPAVQFSDYKTAIVHQEYGCPKGEGSRIDVVVLNPQEVGEINDYDLKRNGKFLSALAAVEFGTEKTPELPGHIKKDCQKLVECGAKNGYVAVYYRDRVKSKKGRRLQEHLERVQKVEEGIRDAWKEYGVTHGLKFYGVIRYIHARDGIVYERFENGEWRQYKALPES